MPLRDSLAAIVIFAFSAAAFVLVGEYGAASTIFPRGIAAVMMFCSAILFIRGIRQPTFGNPFTRREAWRVAVVILGTVLYIIAISYLGFVTASVIYAPATAYYLGVRDHFLIWCSTLVFTIAVAVLFRTVFYVPLPPELIPLPLIGN